MAADPTATTAAASCGGSSGYPHVDPVAMTVSEASGDVFINFFSFAGLSYWILFLCLCCIFAGVLGHLVVDADSG